MKNKSGPFINENGNFLLIITPHNIWTNPIINNLINIKLFNDIQIYKDTSGLLDNLRGAAISEGGRRWYSTS